MRALAIRGESWCAKMFAGWVVDIMIHKMAHKNGVPAFPMNLNFTLNSVHEN